MRTGAAHVEAIDLEPGALLALHAAFPESYPALFESAAAAEPLGRFDILFAHPTACLTLTHDGVLTDPRGVRTTEPFLSALDRWWREECAAPSPRTLPFTGGWLLYLGYELAAQIETRLQLPRPSSGPIAQAIRIPAAIVHEHASGRSWIVADEAAAALIPRIAREVERIRESRSPPAATLRGPVIEEEPRRFLDAVERALEYIRAGDIYQANLSRGWSTALEAQHCAHDLYRRLRQTNPGPFSGVALLDDMAVISSSPERLVESRDGWVTTRPLAGTRPRGADRTLDDQLARELHAHPKERAEHVMLIDLERNDLGRICEAGTVHVDELMVIESYAHVHHIVSNVRGKLRPGVTPGGVLAAMFPGGTITGCPKIRCMEIIAELEQVARGPYTGSLGYLNLDGSMDMNILIRSLQLRGAELTLRAGAGIVADSVPERELEETRAKARGVLRALSEES